MDELLSAPEELPQDNADETIFNFATIGSVYKDGVTLIFDGQTEATDKHYKCNTSIRFTSGDRVKIVKDSGTYVVEYVVGAPNLTDEPHGVPSGGSANQLLAKNSNGDYDLKWANPPQGVPSGGSANQVLAKNSNNSGLTWADPPQAVPSGGSNGQVLTKNSSGFGWAAVPTEIPSSGTTGHVLTKNASGFGWAAAPTEIPSGGSTGQILVKTSTGVGWSSGTLVPSGGSTGQILVKTSTGVGWSSGTLVPSGGSTGQVLTKSSTGVGWASAPVPTSVYNNYTTSGAQSSYVIQFRTTNTYGTFSYQIRMGTSGTWKTITVT